MMASLIKQYCGQALGNAALHPVQDAPHPRLDITSRGGAPIPPSRGCRGPNRPRFRPVGSNQTHGICADRVNDLLVWLFRPWLACSRVRPGKFTSISHGLSSLRRSMYTTSYSSVENRLRQKDVRGSLISRLSTVLKDREGGSLTNLDDLWIQVLDHIYVVLELVKF